MKHFTIILALLMTLSAPVVGQSMYTIGDVREFCQNEQKRQQGTEYNETEWGACVGFIQGYRASLMVTCNVINNVRKTFKHDSAVPDEIVSLVRFLPNLSLVSNEKLIKHFIDFANQNPDYWDGLAGYLAFNNYVIVAELDSELNLFCKPPDNN